MLLVVPCREAESRNLSIGAKTHAENDGGTGRRLWRAMTDNFSVISFVGGPDAGKLGQRAEELRQQLQNRWLGGVSQTAWASRCQIVVHESRAAYARSVGWSAQATKGSSLIRVSGGKVSFRRLDLMGDGDAEPSALAHELSHVVLADHFRGQQPPRWADEGIALLSDGCRKQSLHRRDCSNALRQGENLPLVELLTSQTLRNPDRIGAFYGQSLTLVELLLHRGSAEVLLSFLEMANQSGYDVALRTHYGLDGIGDLEPVWRESVLGGRFD